MSQPKNNWQKGITLVELLLVVVAVGFLALLINNLPSSISSINRSRHSSIAREIAEKQLEYLRKQPYPTLANGVNNFSDPQLSTLPSVTAVYEIADCSSQICQFSEVAKEVRVRVSWNESGDNKTVELLTIIAQQGVS